ncbi:MAG: hypothetical protein K0Q67_1304 [Cellvibrio sp.]|jgi:hypothetical protein|nr:hypothetical protein [Cellvibrio sp.]MDF3013912.1 hypothetical protein [Cellvibrio sp.]
MPGGVSSQSPIDQVIDCKWLAQKTFYRVINCTNEKIMQDSITNLPFIAELPLPPASQLFKGAS